MQWAVRECERLGLEFDLSVDFGYGSGGPHITPELSMQKLFWSETEVEGGRTVNTVLPKPAVAKNLSAWLRPGAEINPQVRAQIENTDSYKDVAVLAIPVPASLPARAYRIPEISLKDGTGWRLPRSANAAASPPSDAVTPPHRVVDLTDRLGPEGRLLWDAPPGKWLILRGGHASNFKMTRPSPAAAVGLECDRLATAGIDTHYGAFLKRIFTDAGSAAGKALTHVHIDSWEAGGQGWTATFPAEFRKRRGYDLRPWLPVLTGRVVGSAELAERFLWDERLEQAPRSAHPLLFRHSQLSEDHHPHRSGGVRETRPTLARSGRSRRNGEGAAQRPGLRCRVGTALSGGHLGGRARRGKFFGYRRRQPLDQPNDWRRATSTGQQLEGFRNAAGMARVVQERGTPAVGPFHLHVMSSLQKGYPTGALGPARAGDVAGGREKIA